LIGAVGAAAGGLAVEMVVPLAAGQRVGAIAAVQNVVPGAADK